MHIESDIKFDFDSVLIRPKRSNAPSRKAVELIRRFKMLHAGCEYTCLPILAANLDTTGTIKMSMALARDYCGCCLHKFYPIEQLIITSQIPYLFLTFGIKDSDMKRLLQLASQVQIRRVCIDAANGYTKYFVNRIKEVRVLLPNAIIMAGNVATPEMVQELILEGADIIKIGIGPGSHCTTRSVTGVGYPQLSAIIECADAAHGLGGLICADGGCKTPADVVKAFGAGADFVMLGGMLAGTNECEGEWTKEGLKVYGMSSQEAQEKYYGGVPEYATSEGRCSIIPRKGPVKNVINEILGGLRSACTYMGAERLKDISKCCTFIRLK